MSFATPLRAAIYGANGHQIHRLLGVRFVAAAEFPVEKLPPGIRVTVSVRGRLEDLLGDPGIDFISLCSPRRADQAAHAVAALRAGKHVYAEKPCALNEDDLDAIIGVARETGRCFREMGAGRCEQPYYAMREVVRSGQLGEIVQVIAEKCYPWHENRPQDEDIDGGLIGQCALYGCRFIEQVAGLAINGIRAVQTTLGNRGSDLRMAASLTARLANGGLASLAANYLNQPGAGIWGYETLRILGVNGWVESTQGGQHTRLVIGGEDLGPLDVSAPGEDSFDCFLADCLAPESSNGEILANMLSPTRWAIRARAQAEDFH
jgi:predicted dehydrogenase